MNTHGLFDLTRGLLGKMCRLHAHVTPNPIYDGGSSKKGEAAILLSLGECPKGEAGAHTLRPLQCRLSEGECQYQVR